VTTRVTARVTNRVTTWRRAMRESGHIKTASTPRASRRAARAQATFEPFTALFLVQ